MVAKPKRALQGTGAGGAKGVARKRKGDKSIKVLREEHIAHQMLCRASGREEVIAHLMDRHELSYRAAYARVQAARAKMLKAAEGERDQHRGEAMSRYREIIRIALLEGAEASAQMLSVAKAAQERIDKLTGAEAALKIDARVGTFDVLEAAKVMSKLRPEDRAAWIDARLDQLEQEDDDGE